MEPARPEFVPDPSLSREGMEALQREIAAAAVFEDDFEFDPGAACSDREPAQRRLGGSAAPGEPGGDAAAATGADPPVVVGVDQAFLDGRAVSALVALRGSEVIERAHAVDEVAVPYVPGLLSFREGGAILRGVRELPVEPDLVVLDGSGRIHFREAGLATHVGVTLGLPSVGVAKSLLCGRPRASTEGLPAGATVPVEADGDVTAPDGTVIGHAVQTRQYDSPDRHVNPVYVSPGHRVSAGTAAEIVLACRGGYKLPEPTRLADAYADEVKSSL